MHPQQTPKNAFQIKNQSQHTTELLIYDVIGDYDGLSAKSFVQALNTIKSDTVTVRINSAGGSVFEGIAIYNALLNHSAKIIIHIEGMALSIASVIVMAGDEVIMAENALMMIHLPMFEALFYVNADDLRHKADLLDKNTQAIISSYQRRCHKTHDELFALMQAETWLTAQEALDIGFIDHISQPIKMTNSAHLDHFKNTPHSLINQEPLMTDSTTPTVASTFNPQDILTIVNLCQQADCSELIPRAIEQNWSKAQTEQKINEAHTIRDLCIKAQLPDKAKDFINTGHTVEQVRGALFEVLIHQQPVIHTQLSPQGMDPIPKQKAINTQAIYQKRNNTQSHHN